MSRWGDLSAQWTMAITTLGILYITGRGLIFIRDTLEATQTAVKETENANAIMREAHFVDQRPWVSVAGVELLSVQTAQTSGAKVEQSTSVQARVILKNTGKTPTKNLVVRQDLFGGIIELGRIPVINIEIEKKQNWG